MIDPKTIKWEELGFGYIECAYRYVSKFKDGKWDDGALITDSNIVLNECACVFQYSQSCFEGLKAYYTKNGDIVCFRPDMNAERMYDSALRLEMPPFPKDKFVEACEKVIAANKDFVPPYGTGASLYLRPFMFGSNPVIGVKPANEYQFRIFGTPVGPYFKGGVKPLTIKVSDFDRAAPNGTGHIKAGLDLLRICILIPEPEQRLRKQAVQTSSSLQRTAHLLHPSLIPSFLQSPEEVSAMLQRSISA